MALNLSQKKQRAFTLVELLVGISIVAILTAVALPNLNSFVVSMRVDNEISELKRVLLTARGIAINTGKITTVCPLSNTGSCTTNWQNEISVFTNNTNTLADGTNFTASTTGLDGDGNAINIDNDELVKVKEAIKSGDSLQFLDTSVIYMPDGRLLTPTVARTFNYCPHGEEDSSRAVDVSISGRVYSSSDIDNDGKDENLAGDDVSTSC